MKMKVKVIFLAASALGAALLLTACGGSGSSSGLPKASFTVKASSPSWKLDKSSAQLSWYVNYDWFAQKWGKDVATKFITDDTHVNVTYQAGDDNKLNSLMASGKLPDIITVDATDTATISKASQWAYPLEELANKYDPYLLTNASKKAVVDYYTNSAGHLYGYPNFATTASDYKKGGVYGNEALMVNKAIYEKIGSPSLSSPEDFLAALKKVQALDLKDASGNKIIPLGAPEMTQPGEIQTLSDLVADLAGIPSTKDGKYYDRYTDPTFKTWMATLNQANQAGLTSADFLTLNADTNASKLANGSYFMYLEPNLNGDAYNLKTDANNNYIAVDAMNGTGKSKLNGPNMQGWTMTFISKKCKNPQKAIELLEYMISPYGDTVMNFGKEGVSYNMVNGVPTLIPAYAKLKQDDGQKYEDTVGLGSHPWVTDSALLSREQGLSQFGQGIQQAKEWTSKNVAYQPELANINNQLTDVETRNSSKIQTNWAQTFAKIFTASNKTAITDAYSAYDAYKTANGYEAILRDRDKQIAYNKHMN